MEIEIVDKYEEQTQSGRGSLLTRFFHMIKYDPRVGISHIALFTAMVQMSQDNFSVSFYGRELRQLAKIGSSRTYFKVLRDLYECQYIQYIRASNRWKKSTALFLI